MEISGSVTEGVRDCGSQIASFPMFSETSLGKTLESSSVVYTYRYSNIIVLECSEYSALFILAFLAWVAGQVIETRYI